MQTNIQAETARRRTFAIISHPDAGKTTLTEILQKNYAPENGKIIINKNLDLKNVSIDSWRNAVSIVPQNIQLFNGNILENIILDEIVSEEKLQQLISLGFDKFINSLPQGFMTLAGEEGINLSGGQKQLLGWMRALYHDPKFLILDEPTSSLDEVNRNFIYNLIHQLKSEKIIFIISHHSEDVRKIADDILVLENTRISKKELQELV